MLNDKNNVEETLFDQLDERGSTTNMEYIFFSLMGGSNSLLGT